VVIPSVNILEDEKSEHDKNSRENRRKIYNAHKKNKPHKSLADDWPQRELCLFAADLLDPPDSCYPDLVFGALSTWLEVRKQLPLAQELFVATL
jgi:hypothetical protein